MNSTLAKILLLAGLVVAGPLHAQQRLYLMGGAELAGLSYGYTFQQQGNVLKRGWLNQKGHHANGARYAMNLSLHYRISKRFGVETGLRFSEMSLSVHDSRFLSAYSIPGGQPKNNVNGTYSNNGNFNIAEWYLANYLSGYFILPGSSRVRPFFSAGIAYNYFVSRHPDISNTFTYVPTGENLEVTAHYTPHYISTFLEAGAFIHLRQDEAKGPVLFVGLKYSLAGKVVTGDYQNTQNGNSVYTDQVTATGSCLSLSVRIGGLLFKRTASQGSE